MLFVSAALWQRIFFIFALPTLFHSTLRTFLCTTSVVFLRFVSFLLLWCSCASVFSLFCLRFIDQPILGIFLYSLRRPHFLRFISSYFFFTQWRCRWLLLILFMVRGSYVYVLHLYSKYFFISYFAFSFSFHSIAFIRQLAFSRLSIMRSSRRRDVVVVDMKNDEHGKPKTGVECMSAKLTELEKEKKLLRAKIIQ